MQSGGPIDQRREKSLIQGFLIRPTFLWDDAVETKRITPLLAEKDRRNRHVSVVDRCYFRLIHMKKDLRQSSTEGRAF